MSVSPATTRRRDGHNHTQTTHWTWAQQCFKLRDVLIWLLNHSNLGVCLCIVILVYALLSYETECCHLCNVVDDSNHNTSLVYVLCIVILWNCKLSLFWWLLIALQILTINITSIHKMHYICHHSSFDISTT